MSDPKLRDVDADYLKAVNEAIALRESSGLQATAHLLGQKAALEAKIAAKRGEHKLPEPFEHKAEDTMPETAVPRKPGRPRKPADADRAADSQL